MYILILPSSMYFQNASWRWKNDWQLKSCQHFLFSSSNFQSTVDIVILVFYSVGPCFFQNHTIYSWEEMKKVQDRQFALISEMTSWLLSSLLVNLTDCFTGVVFCTAECNNFRWREYIKNYSIVRAMPQLNEWT